MGGIPEIKFARAGGSSIAYQIFGDGPITIAAVPPMAQNIELCWEWPAIRHMLERFGSFSRYLHFDKRGTGMSDRSLDIPGIDERVDELAAVLDAEGIEHAFVFGVSEGGPMALMFAATYPDRVDGVILEGTAAALGSDEARERLLAGDGVDPEQHGHLLAFADAWGTPASITPDLFAPSLAADDDFRAWHQRYERQAANRDAILTLLMMNGLMDVRGVLDRIEAPVLMLHRTDDAVVPVVAGRETERLLREAGVDVEFVELPGADHFTYAGDADRHIDAIERFTTGRVVTRTRRRDPAVRVSVMGEFSVEVDGETVETSAWGSKRARTLLKRLVVARGWPVTRDELAEMLWPGEGDATRLGARLSVQLSAVRRVLHGGVVADRSSIRLDLDRVDVDIEEWFGADDAATVERYATVLPDDVYDDWAAPLRDEARDRFAGSARRLLAVAVADDDHERAADLARRLLTVDPYDETAHQVLVRVLAADGRHGEAKAAHDGYVAAMTELDIEPAPWEALAG